MNILYALVLLFISCEATIFTGTNTAPTTPPKVADNYPPNNLQGISTTEIKFSWNLQGIEGTSYDLYFGNTNLPTTKIQSGYTDTSFTYKPAPALSEGSRYYWKVVVQENDKIYESEVFSFITEKELRMVGYLIQSRASAPVAGSTVTIKEAGNDTVLATTTSDADGKFTFSNIRNNSYVVVASKSGRATAKASFTVANNTPPILNMQQFEVASSVFTDFTPPSIAVTGIEDNKIIPNTDAIMISALASDNKPFLSYSKRAFLQLAIANAGSDFHIYKTSDFAGSSTNKATMTYEFNPTSFPSGFMYVVFISYDANNNLHLLYIPIVNNIVGTSAKTIEPPGTSINTYVYMTPETISDFISTYSISENTNASVNIYVLKNNMNGIIVYRADSEGGDYEYIGASSFNWNIYVDNVVQPAYFYKDRLPNLSDNATYYYKLKYYYYDGQSGMLSSEFSRGIIAPLLPRFELELTSPSNNSIVQAAPTTIDFTWNAHYDRSSLASSSSSSLPSANNIQKFYRKDTIAIYEVATNTTYYSNEQTLKGTSEVATTHVLDFLKAEHKQYPIPSSGTQYYWTVSSRLEYLYNYTDNNNNTAIKVIARSYPSVRNKSFSSTANNGLFYFTIK